MTSKFLPALSIALMCFALYQQSLGVFSFKPGPKSKKIGNEAIYEALITGNKSGVPRKTISVMKDFGLMHLLTPSGLHLGSFLLLFKFFPRLKFAVTGIFFLSSFSFVGFLALKRMLIFYLTNFFLKNVQLSFFATFIIALLIGNYSESPLSFCFTFIFWGSIVFHQGSAFSLAKKLFVLQAAIAFLFHQNVNLWGILINPALTTLFSLSFPFFLICYPFEWLNGAGLLVVGIFADVIESLEFLSFFLVSGEMALAIIFILAVKNRALISLFVLFFSTSLSIGKTAERKKINIHYPLPDKQEFLKATNRKIEFIDRICLINYAGDVNCKKKPSHLGGPDI